MFEVIIGRRPSAARCAQGIHLGVPLSERVGAARSHTPKCDEAELASKMHCDAGATRKSSKVLLRNVFRSQSSVCAKTSAQDAHNLVEVGGHVKKLPAEIDTHVPERVRSSTVKGQPILEALCADGRRVVVYNIGLIIGSPLSARCPCT